MWLGLHQDDTDRRIEGKAGHYQSLETYAATVLSRSNPSSHPSPQLSAPMPTAVIANTKPDEIPVDDKLANKRTILRGFPN